MENPFEKILEWLSKLDEKLSHLEEKVNQEPQERSDVLLGFIPVKQVIDSGICSRSKFYACVREGKFSLFKFDNKSFVKEEEILDFFKQVKCGKGVQQ